MAAAGWPGPRPVRTHGCPSQNIEPEAVIVGMSDYRNDAKRGAASGSALMAFSPACDPEAGPARANSELLESLRPGSLKANR